MEMAALVSLPCHEIATNLLPRTTPGEERASSLQFSKHGDWRHPHSGGDSSVYGGSCLSQSKPENSAQKTTH